ncbi:protein FAM183A-like isoform X2 [Hyposmocoma kahamanoa]|nr:protein FAM183A-like isoform X2 [Hyposmocoma kahamanoa]XP_026320780.1 protein FAM183A-like isoform X2 [Hyposmocoma kahamanoa]
MGDKCTFGARKPIDINMVNAIIHREVKHFRNYNIYRPKFGLVPVTSKFYAAHDQFLDASEEESQKVENYHHNVMQARVLGPHSKYPAPVTENLVYGWYHEPLMPTDKADRRFNHHIQENINTKIQFIILMANPKIKKE